MLNTYLHETLAVLPVTQAFRREAANQAHFRGLAKEQYVARTTSNKATAIYVAFIELLAGLTVSATLIVGWRLISAGELQVAELLPFLLYLALAFAPIQQMATVFDIYQRAKTGVTRISALLAEEISVPTPEQPAEVGELDGNIELRGVTLQYNGTRKPALREADLRIGAGERVAFVGQTGAGKSTIAKVITRFYDATDGHVEIDGTPVTRFDPSAYRQSIGYVPRNRSCSRGRSATTSRTAPRARPTSSSRRRRGPSARTSSSPGSTAGTSTRCRSGAARCRPDSVSCSAWPGRSFSIPGCWCSTRRRPTSTSRASAGSSRRCGVRPPVVRRSSSRTARRPCAGSTGWSRSTTAR